jgi:predicted metalloprotease with PDZ domain
MSGTNNRVRHSAILLLGITMFAVSAHATIYYTISLQNPEQHVFHVKMEVVDAGERLILAMPAWNATYDIRDFAYHVTEVRAKVSQGTLAETKLHVSKLDKQTWVVTPPGTLRGDMGTVTIEYNDYWDEPGPFSSQLNSHHAFLNLAEVLFYVPSRRAEPVEVQYAGLPSGWRIAEELPEGKSADSFDAASYDALVDAPAEIGTFQEFQFNAARAAFRVVVDGKSWSQDALDDALRKIVTYETEMMRDVPFHEYMFIFHFGPFADVGGGGMEHANCTAIAVGSGDAAASVSAHEFFHLWNVKRIRPQSLEPVDYSKEMWTRALWFAEGVTSTFGAYTLVRTGIWSDKQFFDDLARQFTELESRPAHLTQSAEESSLDTWLDKYDYYNRPEVSISYYNKGQILGVILDLAIRDATNNHKSLDDVLRAMDQDYAHAGKFYDDSAGIEQEIEKVSGNSFKDFFAKYVAGTAEIPYADFLKIAGLDVKTDQREIADFGFEIERGPDGRLRVGEIAPGSSAEQAGIKSGDVLLQLDGQPFPRFAGRFLAQQPPGRTVKLRVQRDGTEQEVSLTLGKRMLTAYSISEMRDATDLQKRIRAGLLKGTTD